MFITAILNPDASTLGKTITLNPSDRVTAIAKPFRNVVFYGGNSKGKGSMYEFRLGSSYAAVTPTVANNRIYIRYAANYYPFGAPMPGRSFSAGLAYRYGFNGKEKDNETSWQDYGFRMYYPDLGRFFSPDPIGNRFPMLSPYQFAGNTPIWAVDLDGLEARVYNDLSMPIGHTFISLIDDEGVINVYTFGQYGEGKKDSEQGPAGEGALVHLKGDAANEYINHEFKEYGNKIQVYEISDKTIRKEEVINYYSDLMKKYNTPATSTHFEVGLVKQFPKSGSKAVKYNQDKGGWDYCGLPIWFTDDKNCTSVAIDGLLAGQSHTTLNQIKNVTSVPQALDQTFKNYAKIFSNRYKNVTSDAKAKAKSNANSTPKPRGKIRTSGEGKKIQY